MGLTDGGNWTSTLPFLGGPDPAPPTLLHVRLVDGVGNSCVVDLVAVAGLTELPAGCTYDMPRPPSAGHPPDLETPPVVLPPRVTFAFTGERDQAGLPVLRQEATGFPRIRYPRPR
jgi:hypothetical protein